LEQKKLDAIIFDVDGTLTNTAPRQEQWFKHWSEVNNITWPFSDFDEFLTVYNDTLARSENVLDGVQTFYDSVGLPCNMKDRNHRVWPAYEAFQHDNPTGLYDGIKEAVSTIHELGSLTKDSSNTRRIRLGIVTNNLWSSVYRELLKAQILPFFDVQVGAEMLDLYHGYSNGNSLKKPSKISLNIALDTLGARGQHTMHVCDTRYDLHASRNILRTNGNHENLITVGVAWGYEGKEKLSNGIESPSGERHRFDHIIDEPSELVPLVKTYLGQK